MDSYGDLHVCPNHDGSDGERIVVSGAHGETCPKCGWPGDSLEDDDD